MINVVPILSQAYYVQTSVIKFIIAPFVKAISIQVLKNEFMSSKKDLDQIMGNIQRTDINDKHILQKILQPIVKELDINIIESRKQWLDNA